MKMSMKKKRRMRKVYIHAHTKMTKKIYKSQAPPGLIEIDCRCGELTDMMMERRMDEAGIGETLLAMRERPVLLRGAVDAWCAHPNAWSMQELMMDFTNFAGRVRLKYDNDNDVSVQVKEKRRTEFVYSEDTQCTNDSMPMWEFLMRLMLTMSSSSSSLGWMPRWLAKTIFRDADVVKVYMQALMNEEMERRIGIEEKKKSRRRRTGNDHHTKSWLWRLISKKGMEATQARKIWISAGGSVTVCLLSLVM